jgi:hypothetical protein
VFHKHRPDISYTKKNQAPSKHDQSSTAIECICESRFKHGFLYIQPVMKKQGFDSSTMPMTFGANLFPAAPEFGAKAPPTIRVDRL